MTPLADTSTQTAAPPSASGTARAPDPPRAGEGSYLEIDMDRLDRNVQAIRELVGAGTRDEGRGATDEGEDQRSSDPSPLTSHPSPLLCGVVKKNAYGLGAVQIAPRLVMAGCDMLSVFSVAEAQELVERATVHCPILLMAPLRELGRAGMLYRHAIGRKLHLAIHDRVQLGQVNAMGRTFGLKWPVHLYLDTGMSRSGLNLGQFARAVAEAKALTHVRIVGVFSHLATADADPDFARHQFRLFEAALAEHAEKLPQPIVRHIANTCGLLRDRSYHMDLVRPGLGLYGYGPELLQGEPADAAPEERSDQRAGMSRSAISPKDLPALQPILRWVSRIVHVQQYRKGACVGYGRTHRLEHDSILGIVPVGYGDGYPLALSDQAVVRVHPQGDDEGAAGARMVDAPVIGRVNMDQIVVDLTPQSATSSSAAASASNPNQWMGGVVEVISKDAAAPNALPKLAKLAQSHPYEMLCRLSPRLPRRHVHKS